MSTLGPAEAVARTLVAAFTGNPFYEAILAGASGPDRDASLTAYFLESVREGEADGRVVYATPPERGVAIWIAPLAGHSAAANRKHAALAKALPAAGYAAYCEIGRAMSEYSRQLIDPGTWYLSILGVHPAHQGEGIGAALLAGTLAELDAAGASSYLETFTSEAVRFYEKLGYRIVGETEEPTLRRRYWVMRRVRPRGSP